MDGPALAVSWRVWLHTRRQPKLLGLLAVPALVVGLGTFEGDDVSITLFPLFIGFYSVWVVTMTMTITPLKGEESTLPHLLTAPGRDVTIGYLVPQFLVGVPVVVSSVVLAVGLAGPGWLLGPSVIASLAVPGGTAPATLAMAVAFPKITYLPETAENSLTPSNVVMVGMTAVAALLALPPTAALLAVDDSSTHFIVVLALATSVVSGVLIARYAVSYTASRLDAKTLE